MKSNAGATPRVNLTIPWSEKERSAFYKMTEALGAKNAAEVARKIITEAVHWYYGLEEAKKLGLLESVAESIDAPHYALRTVRFYIEANKNPSRMMLLLRNTLDITNPTDIKTQVTEEQLGYGRAGGKRPGKSDHRRKYQAGD